jgi:hypothetical protein
MFLRAPDLRAAGQKTLEDSTAAEAEIESQAAEACPGLDPEASFDNY